MRLKDYDERDGKRVWLSDEELSQFIEHAQSLEQRLAFQLAGRVGLRRNELMFVKPRDFVTGPTGGKHVRVWNDYAKQDKYREPPVPDTTMEIVNALSFDRDDGDSLIETEHGSTIYRWVEKAAAAMEEETGDRGWQFLDVHDLRRTWGVYLLEQGVIPSVVMEWGGWSNWQTFRRHYLSELSPEGLKREREKVDYLGGSRDGDRESGFQPADAPNNWA